jgi:hypothetical protein
VGLARSASQTLFLPLQLFPAGYLERIWHQTMVTLCSWGCSLQVLWQQAAQQQLA